MSEASRGRSTSTAPDRDARAPGSPLRLPPSWFFAHSGLPRRIIPYRGPRRLQKNERRRFPFVPGSSAPKRTRRPWKAAAGRRSRTRVLGALRHHGVVALAGAEIDLTRTRDLLLFRVLDHLLPLREPARGARDLEEHREHVDGEAHRLVDDARVEVDVRVELALDEVLVLERDPFELDRDLEQRIVARDLEDLIGHLLDDLGARVEVLVDAV